MIIGLRLATYVVWKSFKFLYWDLTCRNTGNVRCIQCELPYEREAANNKHTGYSYVYRTMHGNTSIFSFLLTDHLPRYHRSSVGLYFPRVATSAAMFTYMSSSKWQNHLKHPQNIITAVNEVVNSAHLQLAYT